MNVAARLVDVKKTYQVGDLAVPAVQGVDLDIESGAFLSIAGPSGSGKTTILNLLGALDTPTSGTIWIGENETNGLSAKSLADFRNTHLGFVFQTFNLLPRMTALENVALPLVYGGVRKSARVKKATEVLNAVGLGDRMDHKPNELSGGQRQRVAIARALVNDPSIILADEPTGNLDSRTSHEILEILEKIHADGNTIVLVTHEHDISLYAHRIIRLMDGLVASDENNLNPLKTADLQVPVEED